MNFLAELFKEGYTYSSLNSYISAISSTHKKIDGHMVGQHKLVTQVAFHKRPTPERLSGETATE